MISDIKTVGFLAFSAILIFAAFVMGRRRKGFSTRLLYSAGMGFVLGLAMQFLGGFPQNPMEVVFIRESAAWFGLVGCGYLSVIRLLAVPLVMASVVRVIISMEDTDETPGLVRKTVTVTAVMAAIAAVTGLAAGVLLKSGGGAGLPHTILNVEAMTIDSSGIPGALLSVIPSNPFKAMAEPNIIGVVIFSALIGFGSRHAAQRHGEVIYPFLDLIEAFYRIIAGVVAYVIKLMPYAVIPLLAYVMSLGGVSVVLEAGKFILALYAALAVMFVIQLIALALFGVNPARYVTKGIKVFTMSIMSHGAPSITADTLTDSMGVSNETASLATDFCVTTGVQGCAGVFPALVVVFVANMTGTTVDIPFLLIAALTVVLGSMSLAGIPGTSVIAACVALSGMGMAAAMPLIAPVLAVEALTNIGRSPVNVSGVMANAIIVDKRMGLFDHSVFSDTGIYSDETDENNDGEEVEEEPYE